MCVVCRVLFSNSSHISVSESGGHGIFFFFATCYSIAFQVIAVLLLTAILLLTLQKAKDYSILLPLASQYVVATAKQVTERGRSWIILAFHFATSFAMVFCCKLQEKFPHITTQLFLYRKEYL